MGAPTLNARCRRISPAANALPMFPSAPKIIRPMRSTRESLLAGGFLQTPGFRPKHVHCMTPTIEHTCTCTPLSARFPYTLQRATTLRHLSIMSRQVCHSYHYHHQTQLTILPANHLPLYPPPHTLAQRHPAPRKDLPTTRSRTPYIRSSHITTRRRNIRSNHQPRRLIEVYTKRKQRNQCRHSFARK